MTTEKEKEQRAGTSAFKETIQSPKDVSCSICLDPVENAGDRSIARLKCGHQFHLDCIGSAFNAKGAMECPNCRQVEGGQWLFCSGSYLQQQLLRNSTSEEDYNYTGMLDNLNSTDEHLSHMNRRLPYASHRQMPVESEHPLATNRWRSDVPPRIANVNEIARLPSSDGMYIQRSQTLNMHRASLHGSIFPNSHMHDGPMHRRRMNEDYFLYRHEPASDHRFTTNRAASDRNRDERELVFGGLALPNDANVEQAMPASLLHGVAYNTRRLGAYTSRIQSGHEWGNSHESVRWLYANPFDNEVHHLHSLSRAAASQSYYDGHFHGARVP